MATEEGPIRAFTCDHVGVSGSTQAFVRKLQDGRYEARMGVALLGSADPGTDCPFDEEFNDNYAVGFGASEDEALADMKADVKKLSNSLWD